MLDFTGLNWIAIVVSTALAFVLGGLWYGPLFGKAWLSALVRRRRTYRHRRRRL
ncbi:MAG: DUF1761 domain-containing protein [Gammaproteobacteria bacterium]|nr:DUF1761 domain-containing protein [Gammaproteobacteria bacterium]